jgi:glycerol kinase
MSYTLAIDQSTSATKVLLFDENENLVAHVAADHQQYYPKPGWVEHDAEEILKNVYDAVGKMFTTEGFDPSAVTSVAITNQRETVVVWDAETGKPVYNAVVWQCQRGAELCSLLREKGYGKMVQAKTGLLIDPYFSASGVTWILDHVSGAREKADGGKLRMGTVDSWLIWNLTGGHLCAEGRQKAACAAAMPGVTPVHATDYTNASRTLLFNIHTLDWDDELLDLFTIPRSMLPVVKPSDAIFGDTDLNGLLPVRVPVAGVLGDSHGALVGQMCFEPGMGKATYGTGSSVMVNTGLEPCTPPVGLVTSIGFVASGKVFYAFEGNIHCTGATIKWMVDDLELLENSVESESLATAVPDNGGVYFVPAFAGLGAPWWNNEARALICGMSRGSNKKHIVRAALEAIAYQVKDLTDAMTSESGVALKELRVDGGPVRNHFLMQFQADMLNVVVNRSPIKEASAYGAVLMNALALGRRKSLQELLALRSGDDRVVPSMDAGKRNELYAGWKKAVKRATL